MIDKKLSAAANVFRNTGVIDSTIIPEAWRADNMPQDHTESLAVFQIALVRNMARTCRHSIDLMHVCFRISEVLQFYRHDIVRNEAFWIENDRLNGAVLNNGLQIFNQDIKNMQGYLQTALDAFTIKAEKLPEGERSDLVPERDVLISLVQDMGLAAQEGQSAASRVMYFNDRAAAGKPYCDPHEQPDLPEGQNAEAYAKTLYSKMAVESENLLDANEDYIRLILARAFYIQDTIVPAEPENLDVWAGDVADNQNFVTALHSRLVELDNQYKAGLWFTSLAFNR